MSAASHGRTDCVRLLLDAGADKNVRDNVRRWSAASAIGRYNLQHAMVSVGLWNHHVVPFLHRK
jgi:hypothetical protein